MIRIEGHFCGQAQPHAAHVWTSPPVYGSISVPVPHQCGGLLHGPVPAASTFRPSLDDLPYLDVEDITGSITVDVKNVDRVYLYPPAIQPEP